MKSSRTKKVPARGLNSPGFMLVATLSGFLIALILIKFDLDPKWAYPMLIGMAVGLYLFQGHRKNLFEDAVISRGWQYEETNTSVFAQYDQLGQGQGKITNNGLITGSFEGMSFLAFTRCYVRVRPAAHNQSMMSRIETTYQVFVAVEVPGGEGFLAVSGPGSTFVDNAHPVLRGVGLEGFRVTGDLDATSGNQGVLTESVRGVMAANPDYAWVFQGRELVVVTDEDNTDMAVLEETLTQVRRMLDAL